MCVYVCVLLMLLLERYKSSDDVRDGFESWPARWLKSQPWEDGMAEPQKSEAQLALEDVQRKRESKTIIEGESHELLLH